MGWGKCKSANRPTACAKVQKCEGKCHNRSGRDCVASVSSRGRVSPICLEVGSALRADLGSTEYGLQSTEVKGTGWLEYGWLEGR